MSEFCRVVWDDGLRKRYCPIHGDKALFWLDCLEYQASEVSFWQNKALNQSIAANYEAEASRLLQKILGSRGLLGTNTRFLG